MGPGNAPGHARFGRKRRTSSWLGQLQRRCFSLCLVSRGSGQVSADTGVHQVHGSAGTSHAGDALAASDDRPDLGQLAHDPGHGVGIGANSLRQLASRQHDLTRIAAKRGEQLGPDCWCQGRVSAVLA